MDDSGNEFELIESQVYGNSRRAKIVVDSEEAAFEAASSFLERQDYAVQSYEFDNPYLRVFTDEGVKLFYLR